MPCEVFNLCHMSQSQTIITNHNGRWRSIFQKNNNLYVQKSSLCYMLDSNGWITINNVSMTL